MGGVVRETGRVVAMTARKIDSVKLRQFAIEGRTTKEMSEHFTCTTETVRRWLRRNGLLDQWIEQRSKVNTCEHCGIPSADRFCSQTCWGYARRRTIDASLLSPYVETGTPLLRMSAELKLDRGLLRSALLRNGQFKDWAQRRYKKCASLKAGTTSATTASVVATTPSAGSVARMAGGTNCG